MHPLVETLGGVGLFLYGMSAMTSGLRKLAGDRLRGWLQHGTRSPWSGAALGTAVTALLQSSSATTVAAVGFVAAGLLTFGQALGIIFGANIGTTLTGWMVALIGFKLKLAVIALPLVFVAAILYLFKSKRPIRGAGKALAGFCLIFIGISFLQNGLAAYRDIIDLSQWSADNLAGRLLLVLVGATLALITQSSSATVAASLTALNTSVLSLPQAAAVVIGADVGTTVTAALATVGGTTAARRTGMAHVIYNLMTGAVAFIILPAYLWAMRQWMPEAVATSPEVVTVGFHSFFNTLGVVLVLPFTAQFARFIESLFPETGDELSTQFDDRLLADPATALEALERGIRKVAVIVLQDAANAAAGAGEAPRKGGRQTVLSSLTDARAFAVTIGAKDDDHEFQGERLFDCIHLIDHLERLAERAGERRELVRVMRTMSISAYAQEVEPIVFLFRRLAREVEAEVGQDTLQKLKHTAEALEYDKWHFRQRFIESSLEGKLTAEELDSALDGHRWLRRMTYHGWRIAHYARGQRDE